jgi:hypothetical protein
MVAIVGENGAKSTPPVDAIMDAGLVQFSV